MIKPASESLARGVDALIKRAPELARDAIGLAAVGGISYGAWLERESAGFIVGGALVLAGIVAAARGEARKSSGQ